MLGYYFYFERITPENTALLYYVQVGVIDMARVRLPVLQYELSMTMKDSKRRSASRELKTMVDDRFEEAIESYPRCAYRLSSKGTTQSISQQLTTNLWSNIT